VTGAIACPGQLNFVNKYANLLLISNRNMRTMLIKFIKRLISKNKTRSNPFSQAISEGIKEGLKDMI